MEVAPVPPAPADRRTLYEEILVVLSLSFLASVASSILSLIESPISGVVVASSNQSPLFARQVLSFVFGLAPAFLVVHLLRRSGEGVGAIGLTFDQPRRDLTRGVLLALLVGVAGIGVYLAAVELGVNRSVVPAPPEGHWWTYVAVFLNPADAAIVEEVIVLGYLVTRLQQVGWSTNAAIGGSALLRGGYHLYQGFGGFAGNLAMGLLFGWLFVRWRRTWPFVVAHFVLDVGAAIGWLWFRDHLPGF
ncbi:MAG TPA: type II CAAX endopeptidase family protein [Actinomycetota bacterium]|jgi:membrane protease YdiL (CAAX protease family)